jgi:hypothetical protein
MAGSIAGQTFDPYEVCEIPPGEAPFALVGAGFGAGGAVAFVLRHAPEAATAAGAALFALLDAGTWPTNETLEARRGKALAALVEVGADLDAPATVALETVHRAMGLPRREQGELVWDDERGLGTRHPSVVNFLSVLARDRRDLPSLLRAADRGSPIVPLLLVAGAKPTIVDRTGRGALHLA